MKRLMIISLLIFAILTVNIIPASAETLVTLDKNSAQVLSFKNQNEPQIQLALAKDSAFVITANDPEKVAITPGDSNADIAARESSERADAAAKALAASLAAQQAVTSTFVTYTGDLDSIFRAAASKYNVSYNLLVSIAHCESGYNPNAYNSLFGASGIFQFLPSTFRGTPYGSGNIFDPVANIYAGAWLMTIRGTSPWYSSSACWGR